MAGRYDPGSSIGEPRSRVPGPLPRARRVAGAVARRLGLRGNADAARLQRARHERDVARERLQKVRADRDAQRQRATRLADELGRARATATVEPSRDRTDLSYVFVVTYGRSGSTLLQGILSATPGVVVRGENGGVIKHLFAFHATVARHRDRLAREDVLPPSHPWWGVDGYPDATALRDLHALLLDTVLRPEADTTLVGFKEIDWPSEQLAELFAFMRAVFPGARFVLNTRDLEQVAASKWWARNPHALAELTALEQRYVAALSQLGDDAWRRVHYDDWVAEPAELRGLFEWLGLDFDEDRVRGVLDVPHSY
jgi:hypothetical protein